MCNLYVPFCKFGQWCYNDHKRAALFVNCRYFRMEGKENNWVMQKCRCIFVVISVYMCVPVCKHGPPLSTEIMKLCSDDDKTNPHRFCLNNIKKSQMATEEDNSCETESTQERASYLIWFCWGSGRGGGHPPQQSSQPPTVRLSTNLSHACHN